MNTKQTWWLTGAAIALFLFIVLFERREPSQSEADRASTALIQGLRLDQITAVEIVVPDQPTIRMEKAGKFWMMETPVHYPVTPDPWLQLVERATWIIRLAPDELDAQGNGLTEFGLNPPKAKIVFHHGAEQKELLFGNNIPVGNRLYAQIAGQDDVMITDALLFEALPKSANDWRYPGLLNFLNGTLNFERVDVQSTNHGYSFQLDPTTGGWRLTRPFDSRADSQMVNELLFRIAPGWRIEEFVSDDPNADVEQYGLDAPFLKMAYAQGSNDVLSVQFGNSPTNRPDLIYARQVQFTNVVLTARTNIDFLQLPYTYWRDRKLVSIDTNRVNEITADYVFGDQVFSYKLKSDTNHVWKMVEPEVLPADAELVDGFFTALNTLRIVAFEKDLVTDFAEYGLATPPRQFSFGIYTNLPNTNGYPTLSFGTNANEQAFARRSDEIAVYSIGLGNFGELPLTHWQWRDRTIWSFDTNNVKRVFIEQHGRQREVVRADDGGWFLAPGSTGILDFSFDEAVFQMAKLKADNWVAKGGGENSAAQFGFKDPPHRVSFELRKNGVLTTNTVTFGGLRDGIFPFASVMLDDGVNWFFDFPVKPYHDVIKRNFSLPKTSE